MLVSYYFFVFYTFVRLFIWLLFNPWLIQIPFHLKKIGYLLKISVVIQFYDVMQTYDSLTLTGWWRHRWLLKLEPILQKKICIIAKAPKVNQTWKVGSGFWGLVGVIYFLFVCSYHICYFPFFVMYFRKTFFLASVQVVGVSYILFSLKRFEWVLIISLDNYFCFYFVYKTTGSDQGLTIFLQLHIAHK